MVKCSICDQVGVNKNSAGRVGVKGKVDHPCISAPVADEAPALRASLGDVELYVLVRDSLDRIDGVLSDGDDELCRAFGDLRLVENDLRLVEGELLRRRPSLAARGRA